MTDWIFALPAIGDDVERIMKPGEEAKKKPSYFPYHMDLGVYSRSPYSASVNDAIFGFIHLTGAISRFTRSLNARHICEKQVPELVFYAGYLAFAYKKSGDLSQVFRKVRADWTIEGPSRELILVQKRLLELTS